jgi:subtilisin family serine protease
VRCLDLINLPSVMKLTGGSAEIIVGLIDGPVATDHPDLADGNIREMPGELRGTCVHGQGAACAHGTFVAGILSAKRTATAPAICPDCTLLLRPIFAETVSQRGTAPSATQEELADAILDCTASGVRVINLSVAIARPSSRGQHRLEESLDHAARRGVIVVAAAGNQGTLGTSAITRHQWVIPVVACDDAGRPIPQSNLAGSIGRSGLSAPGSAVTSLGTDRSPLTMAGTSIAAPFVTGAIALLWSMFPGASASRIKLAVTGVLRQRRAALVPPLLDAWAAYQALGNAA